MINYQSDVCSDRFIISIEGHSGVAPVGHDIICAAASGLALTLVEAFKKLDEEGELSHFYYSVSKGAVALDATVKARAGERAATIAETITDGFLLLEEHYPEQVSVG